MHSFWRISREYSTSLQVLASANRALAAVWREKIMYMNGANFQLALLRLWQNRGPPSGGSLASSPWIDSARLSPKRKNDEN